MLSQKLYERLVIIFSVVVLIVTVGQVYRDYFVPNNPPDYAQKLEDIAYAGIYLVNINTADKTELKELDGIGDVLSERIIDFREKHGPYSCAEDLTNVEGISEKLMEKLRDKITF